MNMTQEGLIVKSLSGFYYVRTEDKIIDCRARGVMRKNGVTPLVGDRVKISVDDGLSCVDEIIDRRNFLLRPPVANVDRLYIISSFENPAPNTLLIDKQICTCEKQGIEPIIVLNKCDEGNFDDINEIYVSAGYEVYIISCKTGEGIYRLRQSIKTGISVFTGNSGVGKSSLLNTLLPRLNLKTGEISDRLGRGRHTTRHVELFDIGNGCLIADTPGFSTVECEPMLKENIAPLFKEFGDCLGNCRFTSCSHTCEKGCAVIDAVNSGRINRSRHESYCELYKEASMRNSWEVRSR